MSDTYEYDIDVNTGLLDQQIRASDLADLFDGLQVDESATPNHVTVVTTIALDASQQADLEALIVAHDPEWVPSTVKLFRYIEDDHGFDVTKPPRAVDYVTGLTRRLYRAESFTQGELRRVEFYAETGTGSDGWPTYSDRVIREDITYTRDALGFAKSRDTTITWYTEDDEPHANTKVLHKPYSLIESQKEGATRRANIISALSLKVAGVLLQILPTGSTYPDGNSKIEVGRLFLQEHKTAVDMFISAAKRDIVADVKHAPDAWLDTVIGAGGFRVRDLLLAEVDIWGIAGSV